MTRLTLQLMRAVALGEVEAWLRRSGALLNDLLRQPDAAGILRVLLTYLLQGEKMNREAFLQEIRRIGPPIENKVMTIAKELIQEGLQKGRQEGALIGKIQILEKILHLPETDAAEVESENIAGLKARLKALETRFGLRGD